MEGQTENSKKNSQTAFIKLCISLFVLGAALILRTFFPDQTQSFLRRTVAGGMDLTVFFGDVGDSLRSLVTGAPQAEETEDASAVDEAAFVNGGLAETYDPETEPPPEQPGGLGGFDVPVLWADARFLLSEFDGEDDTLPLPFGLQIPDRVDYETAEVPFETVTPAAGRLSSSFGYRVHPIYGDWRFHYGIDIANKSGTPITAFADGTVAAVGSSAGYGNYLIIEHEEGFFSLYAHCQKVTAKTGEKVKAGDEIATIGSTGLSTGPHLHFELRRGSAFLDPAAFLGL